MLFDTSGSLVIIKECGRYVVHGLHGNGMDLDQNMYEFLQLVQTQKKWIQEEIFRWTGRETMLDACAKVTYDDHPRRFPDCSKILQDRAVSFPWD